MLPIIGPILAIAEKVLDRVLPDTVDRDKAKAELAAAVLAQSAELQRAAADIVLAEAKSEHVIAAIWRPVLMLTITAIIANNYILAPYLQAAFGWSVTLDLPGDLWTLLTVGVGGYVVGRSGEKIAKTLNLKGGADG